MSFELRPHRQSEPRNRERSVVDDMYPEFASNCSEDSHAKRQTGGLQGSVTSSAMATESPPRDTPYVPPVTSTPPIRTVQRPSLAASRTFIMTIDELRKA